MIEETWHRVIAWLRVHAPATATAVRPPPGDAALAVAQEATGRSWPVDLVAWYRLMDGTQRTPAGYLLPDHCPMPLESIVRTRASMLQGWAAALPRFRAANAANELNDRLLRRSGQPVPEDPYDLDRLDAESAGSASMLLLPSFLPIAEDQSGGYLVVDTRAGELHGCVLRYEKVGGAEVPTGWPSVGALLADVADALEAPTPRSSPRPEVEDGRLSWFG